MLRIFVILLFLVVLSVQTVHASPRTVALTPGAADMLLALGCEGSMVGRSGDCGPGLSALPDVGPYDRPSLEKTLALAPELCVASADGTPPAFIRRLREQGKAVLTLEVRSFESLLAELRRLGDAMGCPVKAAEAVRQAELRLRRAELRKQELRAGRHSPTVLFLVQEKPPMAAGPDTFIGALIEKAGGRRALAVRGEVLYPVLGREALAALEPDIVLVADMGAGGGRMPVRLAPADFPPELAESRAYAVDADLFTRPSLRALGALDQLIEILHAPPY
ncbi:MAG: ABC transporter substrate-binding protein [Mailhella sp.]|nr:ABC transporter substrate-binding protein [Mailhella sp.]